MQKMLNEIDECSWGIPVKLDLYFVDILILHVKLNDKISSDVYDEHTIHKIECCFRMSNIITSSHLTVHYFN